MIEERYKNMFGGIHPTEALLCSTLAAAAKPKADRRWMLAAACTLVLIVTAACWITLPPKDVHTSNGEAIVNCDEFLPLETAAGYGCCDVRDMALNIVSGSIRRGSLHDRDMLFLEVELVGEGLHQDMVLTMRLQDGSTSLKAFHLLCTEVKHNEQGEKMVSHLVSCAMGAEAIPPEGRRLTLAVNNYDCGSDHDRYPHWTETEAWEVVLPDCNTVDFTVTNEGWILLPNE